MSSKVTPPTARQASHLMGLLSELYPSHPLEVNNHPEPFRVLVGTMLSSRTKDPVTNEAMRRLMKRAKTPRGILRIPQEELAEILRPVGFYKQKAAQLHGLCAKLIEDYGGAVPATREELMSFPGVGRKVANLVLNVCFDVPAICVDTHVHRICNRLGWIDTKTPEKSELELEKILNTRHWAPLNRVLVNHGQQICHPVSPKCSVCQIEKYCKKAGVKRKR